MSSRFVIVHRTYDPIQAELLGDLLRDSGIAARVLGTRSAALVGVASNIMQMHIEVPAAQAGAATDFLEAYFGEDGEELLRREGLLEDTPGEDDEAESGSRPAARLTPPGEDPRRPLVAAGAVMLLFGFGHLYARRPWTAAVLAGGQIWALCVLAGASSWPELAEGATLFSSILLFDLVGAQLACRAANRGVRRAASAQLALGAAFVAAAVALGSTLGPRIPPPAQEHPAERMPAVPSGAHLLYE